jgi:hypothetical protein
MEAKKLTFIEAASATVISKSKLNEVSRDEANLTDIEHVFRLAQAIRTSGYPGATIDWLIDEAADWPPPDPDRKVFLHPLEERLIRTVRDAFGPPGEAWEEAFERINLRGRYYNGPTAATQAADAARPGQIPRGITGVETGHGGEDLTKQHEQEEKDRAKEATEKHSRKNKGRA